MAGTKVQILGSRKLDKSNQGFENWSFMSVMTWGEYAYGEWKITIHDKVSIYLRGLYVELDYFALGIYYF